MSDNQEKKAKPLVGEVVSDKMQKTIVVLVTRKVPHELYKKYVQKSTKYHVHDEEGLAKIGDTVKIAQTKPYSKTKTWNLVEVVA